MVTLSVSPESASMAAFRAAVPFGNGPKDSAERLCGVGQCASLKRLERLPGNPTEDRLVYIAQGAAKLVAQSITASDQGTNDHVLAFHFTGDIVSVLRQKDANFQVIALTDLDLVIFPANRFFDIAQDDPVVLRSVLTRSLRALHRSRTRMMQMGHKSARQRIADFLVSMAYRLADCSEGGCEFTLPMSRRDIGDSLGLTIETVSRQFTELREAGLVDTQGRSRVRLNNISQLVAEAGNAAPPHIPPEI